MSLPDSPAKSSARSLNFWFEFGSTYSYLSAVRVEALAAAFDVDVVWEPFLLGPVFSSRGWDDSPFNIYPAKGRYMWRDIERLCAVRGVPFVKPSMFPRNGLLASRVALLARETDATWLPRFVESVFRANFAEDRDISDPAEIASILTDVGADAVGTLEAATTQENKDRLKHQTERAFDAGIFGAPAFTVGDELFWGDDRLMEALQWMSAKETGGVNAP